jgi:hypothetical protein
MDYSPQDVPPAVVRSFAAVWPQIAHVCCFSSLSMCTLVIHYPAFCLASDNDCSRHMLLCSLQSANNTSMVVIHIFSLPQNLSLYNHQQHNLPAYWLVIVCFTKANGLFLQISQLLLSLCHQFLAKCSAVNTNPHVTCTHQPEHVVWQFLGLLYFITSHIIGNPVFCWGTLAQNFIAIIRGTACLGRLRDLLV